MSNGWHERWRTSEASENVQTNDMMRWKSGTDRNETMDRALMDAGCTMVGVMYLNCGWRMRGLVTRHDGR